VISECGGIKPCDEETKVAMIGGLRKRLRGAGLNWLDTVVADLGDSFRGAAIFGTGGNEGSGSYTAAFLAATVECVLGTNWNNAISSSLWSDGSDQDSWDGAFQSPPTAAAPKPKKEKVAGPFRQYLPSGEGSPWDLLLAFEGAIVVHSGIVRRSDNVRSRFLSSPFYFASLGIGAGSSSEMDEFVLNKGRKNQGRGEQWFPLWKTPSLFAEIQTLFREGRCSCGRRTAKNPIDAARALAGLGAARGIATFLRYGYLQRDNLATHFAVPLGRVPVRENSATRLADDLSAWLDRIHRAARQKGVPSRLVHAERVLGNAVFSALIHDYAPNRWQAVLLAAANIETLQAAGTGIEAGPIPPLRPEWLAATNDNSAEFRLALALGSAAAGYSREGRPVDTVRHHFLPLEPGARRFRTSDKKLVNDSRVVAAFRDPLNDLCALVERRLVESAQAGQRRSQLVAAIGCGARLGDLADFLRGSLDMKRLLNLSRAFMAIRWELSSHEHLLHNATGEDIPGECWLALRMCCLPWPLAKGYDIPAEERVVRLLRSNETARAIAIARERLQSVGIRSPMYTGTADSETARRWAAALAFPIHRGTAQHAAVLLAPSMKGLFHA